VVVRVDDRLEAVLLALAVPADGVLLRALLESRDIALLQPSLGREGAEEQEDRGQRDLGRRHREQEKMSFVLQVFLLRK